MFRIILIPNTLPLCRQNTALDTLIPLIFATAGSGVQHLLIFRGASLHILGSSYAASVKRVWLDNYDAELTFLLD